MTLVEYVDAVIRDPDMGEPEWFPRGWFKKKGGPLHVESHKTPGVALCGDELTERAIGVGPARGLLRQASGHEKCEASIPEVAE